MKVKRSDTRARKIERAMQLVWSSLESHLPYTSRTAVDGSRQFHKKCVKEYAELLSILSGLF